MTKVIALYHLIKILLTFVSEFTTMPEKLFKVIIIGDPTVGKTSFVQRYVQNSFKRDYKGTVGVDFALKILKWSETQTIKLQLWDIAGMDYLLRYFAVMLNYDNKKFKVWSIFFYRAGKIHMDDKSIL